MSTPSTPSRASTTTLTQLENPLRLQVLRVIWIAIAAAATVMFLANIPAEFAVFRDAPKWGGGYQAALEQIGLSRNFLAAYTTSVDLIVVLPAIGLAIVVFRQRSNDWLAMLVSITMILYAVGLTMAFALASPTIFQIVKSYGIGLVLWIVFTFPDGRWVPGWTKWLLIGLFALDIITSLLVGNIDANFLYLIGYPIGIIALLIRYRGSLGNPVQHQQVRWLLWGLILAFFASAIYYLIPTLIPELRNVDWDNPVYSVPSLLVFLITNTLRLSTSLIFVTVIGLSIIRYRLWDLDLTINRSLVYGLVSILLALLFLLSIFVIQSLLGGQSQIAFAVSLLGAGALFNPVRKRVQNIIDRRFYGFRFDLNQLAAGQKNPEIKNPGLLTGRTLGDYQVLGVLGRGGMGEVYQGEQAGKTVAIKILPTDLAAQENFRKRFTREAQTLAGLDHPNIVKVFGSGQSDDVVYMAMEYIQGQELADLIRDHGTLSPEEIRPLLEDCAAALDYAHDHGLVHRDIKPSNIMLRQMDGNLRAVLMDFGIAKIQDAQTALTGTGAVGTIDYMAPEQILAAKEVDHRADIYALGVMLYEMLTGERPFKGSAGQVLFAHLQQPPPDPRDVNDDIPSKAAHAVLKALSKNPDDRFQSAGDFAQALQ